jgi:hypothetical protein
MPALYGMHAVKKIKTGLTGLGWWNGLLYVTSRLLEKATSGRSRIVKYQFVAQPVPVQRLAAVEAASSIRIRRVEQDDPLVGVFPRPRHVIAERYASGAVCFAAEKHGTLAGFIWIKREQYREDEVRCLYLLEPADAAAWDFDVWVAPEFRLTRTFARLWDAANAFLREKGYGWSVSRISAFNPASLASHRRLGIVHLETGVFVRVGPVQLAFFTCAPYCHLGYRRSHFPVLRLRAPEAPQRKPDSTTTAAGPLI